MKEKRKEKKRTEELVHSQTNSRHIRKLKDLLKNINYFNLLI